MKVLTFAKEQDAISAKIKTQGEMRSGKYVEPGDLTVKELVEKWLEAEKVAASANTDRGRFRPMTLTKPT